MPSTLSAQSDFIIWGPSVSAGSLAVNAVHALYFLPSHFTLVMPAIRPGEHEAYQRITSLINRVGLAGRVRFTDKHISAPKHAIIAASPSDSYRGHVFGRTPEALASAILDTARGQAH